MLQTHPQGSSAASLEISKAFWKPDMACDMKFCTSRVSHTSVRFVPFARNNDEICSSQSSKSCFQNLKQKKNKKYFMSQIRMINVWKNPQKFSGQKIIFFGKKLYFRFFVEKISGNPWLFEVYLMQKRTKVSGKGVWDVFEASPTSIDQITPFGALLDFLLERS